jgi:hypothetical protein
LAEGNHSRTSNLLRNEPLGRYEWSHRSSKPVRNVKTASRIPGGYQTDSDIGSKMVITNRGKGGSMVVIFLVIEAGRDFYIE